MKKLVLFLKTHLILVIIIVLATFLRTYSLHSHGILFPDAAHDLLTAHSYLKNGSLPLLGIASSRPWLHQGPFSLWIEMLVMVIFGTSTFAQSCIFALIGVGAVIALYELVTIHLSKTAAYIAVAILAVMPLAVAHARVPYHTTPIPLITVGFLWSLVALWKNFSTKQLIITIATAVLLVQFELSNLPLLFLVVYVLFREKKKLSIQQCIAVVTTSILAFLPQLLAVVKNGSSSLITIGQKATSEDLHTLTENSSSIGKLTATLENFGLYGGRMFSVDMVVIKLLALIITTAAVVKIFQQLCKGKLPPIVELTFVSTIVITVAYFFVGVPSEAYFPPYFIFLPILLGYVFTTLTKKIKKIAVGSIGIWMIVNCIPIFNANFFVMNNTKFQYDSVGEHRLIVKYLVLRSNGAAYQIDSESMPAADFPNFLDHIRWLALEEGIQVPTETGKRYLIEGTDQPAPPQAIEAKHFITKNVYFLPATTF